MTNAYRMNLPAVSAGPRTREMLEKTQKQMRMIPNSYARMAVAPGALETYQLGYERFREESGFTSAEQEVILPSISNSTDHLFDTPLGEAFQARAWVHPQIGGGREATGS